MGMRAGILNLAIVVALATFFTLGGLLADAPYERQSARTPEQPALLRVGPGRELSLPSQAAKLARDGDIVEIDAGVYAGDATVWTQDNLTIRGIGGRAHLRANGANAEGKAIWVIKGSNAKIESVEFSGAAVANRNGAGIRQEGTGLTVRDCYFHHNENGILAGVNRESDILIEHSEFAYNGHGDGYSHNMYIGTVRNFTLRFSYVHHAVVGHNVKSRALKNQITYNRIMDENKGRSSYAIDLPDGGLSYVIGNQIQQGPVTENPAIISYGAEGIRNPVNELYLVSNTIVNDLPVGGRFIFVTDGVGTVMIINNLFFGSGELLRGPGQLQNNLHASVFDFVDVAGFDYSLRNTAAAIGRGGEPGHANGVDLRPVAEYLHPLQRRQRRLLGPHDIGALDYKRR